MEDDANPAPEFTFSGGNNGVASLSFNDFEGGLLADETGYGLHALDVIDGVNLVCNSGSSNAGLL